jgi:photosystem II stability/assembly factor-like uncharacterized protein
MKKSWMYYLLLVTLSVLFESVAHAGSNQWTSTGLTDRSVFALVIDPKTPTTVYAGTDQGVFKTVDSGATWTALAIPLPASSTISAVVIDPVNPTILYVAYQRRVEGSVTAGVFKSTDGGEHWQLLDLQATELTALVIDPAVPTTLYAAVNGSNIHKSVNGGLTWKPSGNGITKGVRVMALDPTTPTTLYAGGGGCSPQMMIGGTVHTCDGAVYRSTDGGTTWEATSLTGVAITSLSVRPTRPVTVYARVARSNLDAPLLGTLHSMDAGQSWSEFNFRWWNIVGETVVSAPNNPSLLYTISADGLTRSQDGGAHWTTIMASLRPYSSDFAFVQTVAVDPRTGLKLYAGTKKGVFALEITDTFAPDMLATVESPEADQPVSGIGMIRGWAFATRPEISPLDVRTGGSFFSETGLCCSERRDVHAAFPQFHPQNTLHSGWGGVVNWGALPSGLSHLSTRIGSADDDFFYSVLRGVKVVKPGDFEFLDQFAVANATAAVGGDELVLSDVVVRDKISQQRKQVNLRFRWFTNSQSLGMTQSETVATLSAARESGGPLFARVTNWLRNGLAWSTPASAQAAGVIHSYWESPEDGQGVTGLAILRGWAFPETPPGADVGIITKITLAVDGTEAGNVPCCTFRSDVSAAFPDDPSAWDSGWGSQLNYGAFAPGVHTFQVRLEASSGATQTLTRTVRTFRIGGFIFVDQFDLTAATARIEGEEIVLSGVQVRDKTSQQTKVIEARLRWFQHSQSLGIVASSL